MPLEKWNDNARQVPMMYMLRNDGGAQLHIPKCGMGDSIIIQGLDATYKPRMSASPLSGIGCNYETISLEESNINVLSSNKVFAEPSRHPKIFYSMDWLAEVTNSLWRDAERLLRTVGKPDKCDIIDMFLSDDRRTARKSIIEQLLHKDVGDAVQQSEIQRILRHLMVEPNVELREDYAYVLSGLGTRTYSAIRLALEGDFGTLSAVALKELLSVLSSFVHQLSEPQQEDLLAILLRFARQYEPEVREGVYQLAGEMESGHRLLVSALETEDDAGAREVLEEMIG